MSPATLKILSIAFNVCMMHTHYSAAHPQGVLEASYAKPCAQIERAVRRHEEEVDAPAIAAQNAADRAAIARAMAALHIPGN